MTPVAQALKHTVSELLASGTKALAAIERESDGELLAALGEMQAHWLALEQLVTAAMQRQS